MTDPFLVCKWSDVDMHVISTDEKSALAETGEFSRSKQEAKDCTQIVCCGSATNVDEKRVEAFVNGAFEEAFGTEACMKKCILPSVSLSKKIRWCRVEVQCNHLQNCRAHVYSALAKVFLSEYALSTVSGRRPLVLKTTSAAGRAIARYLKPRLELLQLHPYDPPGIEQVDAPRDAGTHAAGAAPNAADADVLIRFLDQGS